MKWKHWATNNISLTSAQMNVSEFSLVTFNTFVTRNCTLMLQNFYEILFLQFFKYFIFFL